jgi:hypothetical protein
VNRCFPAAVLAAVFLLLAVGRAHAQWVPKAALAAVPVVQDCDETGGDVAVSRLDPPTVYLCPTVVKLIRKKNPGAEHFYFVHEFGHIAQGTSDEAAADCWAARELARAPNGGRYLAAVIELLRQRPHEVSPRYGTPSERADRIRSCADEERANQEGNIRAPPPKRGETAESRCAACVDAAEPCNAPGTLRAGPAIGASGSSRTQ